MGKKNRPYQNGASNNKDALVKRLENDSLENKLRENRELVAELKEWMEQKAAKQEELRCLTEKVSLYGTAEEIVSQKEEMIREAQEAQKALETRSEQLRAEIGEMEQALKRYQDTIGVYESADDIIASANEKAIQIQNDAEAAAAEKAKEYDDLISGAEAEGEAIKKAAQKEAGELLEAAEQHQSDLSARAAAHLRQAEENAATRLYTKLLRKLRYTDW